MPFGLIKETAMLERLIENVFGGIVWSECVLYLDNNR